MAFMPQSVERFAQLGANIEITADAGFIPQSVEQIIRIAVANGAHVTVDANPFMPQSVDQFIQIGGRNVTIRV
jgi:hypothetical protein